MKMMYFKKFCILVLSCSILSGMQFTESVAKQQGSNRHSRSLKKGKNKPDVRENFKTEQTKIKKIKADDPKHVKKGSELKEIEINSVNFIKLPDKASEIFIPEPKYADVQMLSDDSLYIMGLEPGTTSIVVVNKDRKKILDLEVRVTYELKAIKQAIKDMYPDSKVDILSLGDSVILKGRAPSPEVAADIQSVVEKFVDSAKIINKLVIETPTQVMIKVKIAEVSRQVSKEFGIHWRAFSAAKSVNGMHYGFVGGTSSNFTQQADKSSSGSNNSSGESSAGSGGSASGSSGGSAGGAAGGSAAGSSGGSSANMETDVQTIANELFDGPLKTTAHVGRFLLHNGGPGRNNLTGMLDALANESYATVLAEPTLVTVSGKTATFKSGGEIGYTVKQSGTDSNTTEFKDWGTELEFTPVVLAEDRISITVKPKISTATQTTTDAPPSLTEKEAETTVELGSGQSFAIAGLLQSEATSVVDQTPFLADIPLLGSLFKYSKVTNNEREVVIIITAYIVKPSSEELKGPTDMVPRIVAPLDALLSGKFHTKSTKKFDTSSGFSIK